MKQSIPDYRCLSDIEIAEAAKFGDEDAFSELLCRYRPLIRSIARSYFAMGSADEDLMQEALIGAVKAIRTFKPSLGNFRTFLALCIRRNVITFVRMQTRMRHDLLNRALSLDAPRSLEIDESLGSTVAAPKHNNTEDEVLDFLDVLRTRCSQVERNLLNLYTAGYSYAEMAEEIQRTSKAVDNSIWRIKVKARQLRVEESLKKNRP